MVDSVLDDIKRTFRSGNMVSKIILINVAAYIIVNLIYVFDFQNGADLNSFYQTVTDTLSLPSSFPRFIKQPWSIFTHMFLHVRFWHILWNMLLLYWFGQIVGDFVGDDRILPIYIMSGIFGGIVYMLHDLYLPGGTGGAALAMGASSAVMAIIWTAAMLSPDYSMHLLILGPVKLKYIALGLLFMDLLGSAGKINQGGHFAHMGGAIFGILYVYLLRNGTDLSSAFVRNSDKKVSKQKKAVKKTARSKFKVVHNSAKSDKEQAGKPAFTQQEELDRILEKITAKGYDSLSDVEKDFLYKASKKK